MLLPIDRSRPEAVGHALRDFMYVLDGESRVSPVGKVGNDVLAGDCHEARRLHVFQEQVFDLIILPNLDIPKRIPDLATVPVRIGVAGIILMWFYCYFFARCWPETVDT